MQKQDRFTKTLLLLLVLGIGAHLLRPLVAPVDAAPSRAKWEYKFFDAVQHNAVKELNLLGAQGWEVCGYSQGGVILKRQK